MNKPISSKLTKLLKEKGFDNESAHYYNEKGESLFDIDFPSLQSTKPEIYYDKPTIAEVIMWLYEKHGIWIWAERYSTLFRPYAEEIGDERFGKWEGHKYSSPTEAYLAAIEYTLKNLI